MVTRRERLSKRDKIYLYQVIFGTKITYSKSFLAHGAKNGLI